LRWRGPWLSGFFRGVRGKSEAKRKPRTDKFGVDSTNLCVIHFRYSNCVRFEPGEPHSDNLPTKRNESDENQRTGNGAQDKEGSIRQHAT
jgi:hypothetical protein